MNSLQNQKSNAIIHTAATACAGVGASLAQIPGSDNAIIVPIQIAMIMSLGAVFGVNLTKSVASSIVAAEIATLAGRGLSQALVGWIPGIGNVINATTAFGITETVGWTVAKNFSTGDLPATN